MVRKSEPGTVRVVLMGEGEYEVPVASDRPVTFAEMVRELGITDRGGHLYLDGAPADGDSVVRPGSELQVLPRIHGG
jgi:hypothetical protein